MVRFNQSDKLRLQQKKQTKFHTHNLTDLNNNQTNYQIQINLYRRFCYNPFWRVTKSRNQVKTLRLYQSMSIILLGKLIMRSNCTEDPKLLLLFKASVTLSVQLSLPIHTLQRNDCNNMTVLAVLLRVVNTPCLHSSCCSSQSWQKFQSLGTKHDAGAAIGCCSVFTSHWQSIGCISARFYF